LRLVVIVFGSHQTSGLWLYLAPSFHFPDSGDYKVTSQGAVMFQDPRIGICQYQDIWGIRGPVMGPRASVGQC
jgi:hypothetical protein